MNATHLYSVSYPVVGSAGFKKIRLIRHPWCMTLAMLCVLTISAVADQFGDLTYVENVTTITITHYPVSAVGAVVIPATIVGKPVTAIANSAFYQCNALTGVTIPSTVTSIGAGAFYRCTGLTNVVIPSSVTTIANGLFYSCSGLTSVTLPSTITTIGIDSFRYCSALTNVSLPPNLTTLGTRAFANCRGLTSVAIPASVNSIGTDVFLICSALTSISVAEANSFYSSSPDGVLFNKGQTTLIAFPAGKGGGYSIPATVTSVGSKAFFTCEKLVGITFPSSLMSISQEAFSTCSKLQFANFKGDAPFLSFGVFSLAAPNFAVYFMDGSVGFPLPPDDMFWYGYPAVCMGSNSTPTADLILSKGLPANSDLQSDTNGDGVNLLLACALNLDPFQNLSDKIPTPIMVGNQMNLTFYAGAAGITYGVETSCDLKNWSSVGVTLSAPEANLNCTASASISGPCLYMRLAVSN